MQNKRKNVILITIVSIILLSIVGSFAYIQMVNNDNKESLTLEAGTLSLVFRDGNPGITEELEFGKSVIKTFTIENTGTVDTYAIMKFEDLVNTFILGSLTYTLEYSESEEGEYTEVIKDKNVPQSQISDTRTLASSLFIPSGQKYYYKLTIKLNYLEDVDQTSDLNAIFTTHFIIDQNNTLSLETLHLLGLTANENEPDFSQIATTDETKDGLYSLEDDYGTSYYFRGAVENNYVKFAGFYWRIIRINGDGSLRLIYDGTVAHKNGEANNDRAISSTIWNTLNNDAKYVGYMYGGKKGISSSSKEQAQTNETNSDIKVAIDDWYKFNIKDKNYDSYLTDSIYCNDRSTAENQYIWDVRDTALGYGQYFTVYGSTNRLVDTSNTNMWSNKIDATPNLKCPNKEDAFTVNSEKGNRKLTYPIGLITADELVLAGAINHESTGINNNRFYLFKA